MSRIEFVMESAHEENQLKRNVTNIGALAIGVEYMVFYDVIEDNIFNSLRDSDLV